MNQASGTPKDFSCTMTTTAPRERFWQEWTDVPGWPRWDTPLREATLEGTLGVGARGAFMTQGGQRSEFVITEHRGLSAYTYQTRLPGATLTVRRAFGETQADGRLEFTHRVRFSGPLGGLFAALLGRGFMAQLPVVMARLRDLAERDP